MDNRKDIGMNASPDKERDRLKAILEDPNTDDKTKLQASVKLLNLWASGTLHAKQTPGND